MRKFAPLLLALVLSSVASHATESQCEYRLYFPNIDLPKNDGQRIEQVQITVSCGHIEAITMIPEDWNIEIIRAISAVEKLHASAGHGASMLTNINRLNGVIRIKVGEKECFDVSAIIMTSGEKKARKIHLPRSTLRLLP